jgi:hypothetical protein
MSFTVEVPNQDFQIRVKHELGPDMNLNELTGEDLHPELLAFARAVSKKLPHLKFADDNRAIRSRKQLWLYSPHETFVQGKILYNDVSEKYGVYARQIKNERYGTYHDQYRKLWSKNGGTALRKVAANMVPWSVGELASVGARAYEMSRDKEIGVANAKVAELQQRAGISSLTHPAYAYLRSQVKGNARLGDLEFHETMTELVETQDYFEELSQEGKTPMFVYGNVDRHGRQYLDSAKIKVEFSLFRVEVEEVHSRLYEGEPEFDALVNKLAVLNMAQCDHYVRGVGMKHADDMFFVNGQ